MAVKIRLARRGRKKLALYDVVVADARAPRDGRFIEKLGTYNPLTNPVTVDINDERAFHWVMNGAQPTDTVKAMLSYRGLLLKKHLQIGVLKGAITQEQADSKLSEWIRDKETKIAAKTEKLTQSRQAESKARKDAEVKVKEARAEAIRKKSIVPEEPAASEVPAEEPQTGEAQPEASTQPEASPKGENAGEESKAAES